MLRRGAVIGLALAGLLGLGGAAEPAPDASFFSLTDEAGLRLGYVQVETARRPDGGREVTTVQVLTLKERGGAIAEITDRTVRRENAAGATVGISSLTERGRTWTREDAVINGGKAVIVRRTPTDRRQATVDLPPGVRFDLGDALIPAWDGKSLIRFDYLSLDAQAIERVVIEPAAGGALRKRYDGDDLRGVARLTIENGRVAATTQTMFGHRITIRRTDRADALKKHPPYSVLSAVMNKSPYRIPAGAARGHIRYRFGFQDGIAFAPPQTGEQRVRMAPDGMVLDICRACGRGLPSDPAYLERARQPTAWLQSDHPRLRALAASIRTMKANDDIKMQLLIRVALPYLRRMDFAGHYSALETLERRAGDCTEAAVLLAALGRAAGIPTKVASGLVYSRERYHGVSNVFMPHSWTVAYADGAWRSYDLALEDFDATHIALTIGDGDERSIGAAGQLASLLRWDGMTEVRARP